LKNLTINILISITVIFVFHGCELFTTREPEKPDSSKSSFQPPVNPNLVISNFISAINEKNTTNYISCLADTLQSDNIQFHFYPSASAYAVYKNLFDNWNLTSEQQYFMSFVSKMLTEDKPVLLLSNLLFNNLPDSVIFQSDYKLTINHTDDTKYKEFSGSLQFTLMQKSNGLWSIVRWIDVAPQADSIKNTWSIFKAQFTN
jgi:hypothetical protein